MREWPRTVAGPVSGLLGAGALLLVGLALRPLLRAPTLPEVLAEWATFFVPQAMFTYMVNTYGPQAKLMLFWSMVALVLLVGVLAGVAYARWPSPRLSAGLALGLWLLTGLVVLPGAGLGLFGMDSYPAGPFELNAAYLAGWVALALVLSLVYWLLVPSSRGRRRVPTPTAPSAPPPAPSAPTEASR
jgi:hypothetical protein